MLKRKMIRDLKKYSKTRQLVRLITDHPDGDKYSGLMLACLPDMVLFRSESNFQLDGIIALPLKHLKSVHSGINETVYMKILTRAQGSKKPNTPVWITRVRNIPQLVAECQNRNHWPVVETLSKGSGALYIGPISDLDSSGFRIFAYSAEGTWEKNYWLSWKEVFKVEILDFYSTHFNRYMKKIPRPNQ